MGGLAHPLLTMADHDGLCCNPVDCDCWRQLADRTRDDLLRHEGNLERRTEMKDLS